MHHWFNIKYRQKERVELLVLNEINRNIAIYRYKMGITKTENYTVKQIELAQMIKVLGHPARIAIIESIISTDSCICGDLVTEIGLAQSTISQHLKELKSIGLIQGTIEGTSMCYCIDMNKWNKLKNEMATLFDAVETKNEDCCS